MNIGDYLVDPKTHAKMVAIGYVCKHCNAIIDEEMPGHPRDCGRHNRERESVGEGRVLL